MRRFDGQVAIVAGGARGIGRGISERLAREGCKVYVLDLLESELNAFLKISKKEAMTIEGRVCDVTDEISVRNILRQVADSFGRLDILVNCAGIIGATGLKIDEYPSDVFNKVLEVNLTAAFLLTKYAVLPMKRNRYGRILHIASIGGKEGNPGMIGYAASKAGLMGLIKGAGKEYAESGITINGLAPAVIATRMNDQTAPEVVKYMTDKIPMKRMGTIEEVASIATWIVSKEASFNTACIFDLSGGRATF